MKKKKTIVYEGLGFPITLVDVPKREDMGEEILDIDLNLLQTTVLRYLVYQSSPLTGAQLRFIRKFLEMSTTEFAKKFGVTHPTVLKWEKEESPINPTAEFCIRVYALQFLQNGDLRKLCTDISVERLATKDKKVDFPIEITQEQLLAS